jgi:UDP-N-acetylmuramyl pentapeptide phosphotransferase/UDP-N-acetylglucosamine-1-phosphate transferase
MFNYLFLGVIGFLLSYLGVGLIRRWAMHRNVLDLPNERSSHTNPTPRGGGLAIAIIVLAGFVILQLTRGSLAPKIFLGYLLGALIVSAISSADDVFNLTAKIRLPTHFLAAIVFASMAGYVNRIYLPFVGDVSLGWVGFPITVLWIVGFTNAFNFMDGIDGIAAGQAIVAGVFWIVITVALGTPALTTLSILVAGASLGFLFHNMPPARIFMGDVGSTVLGFTFATLPVLAFSQTGGSRLFIVGALFVAPFIFDTTLTMLRRALQKEHLLQAHRSHLYQRLTKLGYYHGSVTTLYIAAAAVTGLMGLAYLWGNDLLGIAALSVVGLLLASIAAGVTWLEHSETGQLKDS